MSICLVSICLVSLCLVSICLVSICRGTVEAWRPVSESLLHLHTYLSIIKVSACQAPLAEPLVLFNMPCTCQLRDTAWYAINQILKRTLPAGRYKRQKNTRNNLTASCLNVMKKRDLTKLTIETLLFAKC